MTPPIFKIICWKFVYKQFSTRGFRKWYQKILTYLFFATIFLIKKCHTFWSLFFLVSSHFEAREKYFLNVEFRQNIDFRTIWNITFPARKPIEKNLFGISRTKLSNLSRSYSRDKKNVLIGLTLSGLQLKSWFFEKNIFLFFESLDQ